MHLTSADEVYYCFYNRKYGDKRRECLFALWEVNLSSISDDYDPDCIPAEELFWIWVDLVKNRYPEDHIPIYWFVRAARGAGIFELMPFQRQKGLVGDSPQFLKFFTEPFNEKNGHPIDWFKLPVADVAWNVNKAMKGGFIQEVTGWKPTALQPFVSLDFLIALAGRNPQQAAG